MDSRAAARLMRDAFFAVLETLPRHDDSEREGIYDFGFALDQWRDDRGVLARSLTNQEWEDVADAAQLVAAISGLRPGEVGKPTTHGRELGFTEEALEQGIINLLADRLLRATTSLERAASGRRHARRVKRESEALEAEGVEAGVGRE
jgi:hypothetical protein